jgi:hypothetical protein
MPLNTGIPDLRGFHLGLAYALKLCPGKMMQLVDFHRVHMVEYTTMEDSL